jgi:hypothetical protein
VTIAGELWGEDEDSQSTAALSNNPVERDLHRLSIGSLVQSPPQERLAPDVTRPNIIADAYERGTPAQAVARPFAERHFNHQARRQPKERLT